MTNEGQRILDDEEMLQRLKAACVGSIGVLNSSFLCQSLSVLPLKKPYTIKNSVSVAEAIRHLKSYNVGCILIVDDSGKLAGIFTERDCLTKIIQSNLDTESTPVSQVMTANPVSDSINCNVGYALSLMSNGQFRHLPLVDDEGIPVGIVSVRDIVDHIVNMMVTDLLEYR